MVADYELWNERTYPHPVAAVWSAWTTQAALDAWWGPDGFSTTTTQFDARPGGEWLFTMTHATYGAFPNRVRYLEIDQGVRLLYLHDAGDASPEARVMRVEVCFDAVPGGTRVRQRTIFTSAAEVERVKAFGAVEFGRQTFARLAAWLEGTPQPRLVVRAFAVSIDGFCAAKGQSLQDPFGKGGLRLMGWAFPTRTIQTKLLGREGGTVGIDDDFLAHADDNVGATIMGRNMFGPQRGPWENEDWRGWWGETPPYRHPVFVLSHHPRARFDMKGGTSFTFVTDGIESALKQAFAAAGGKDVRLGGGASTVRQYLTAGLVDELHLVQVPILLGRGERLFDGLDGIEDHYECVEFKASAAVAHVRLARKG